HPQHRGATDKRLAIKTGFDRVSYRPHGLQGLAEHVEAHLDPGDATTARARDARLGHARYRAVRQREPTQRQAGHEPLRRHERRQPAIAGPTRVDGLFKAHGWLSVVSCPLSAVGRGPSVGLLVVSLYDN